MRHRLGTLLAVLVVATGCVDALSLMTLRSGLTREFHEDEIGVSLTDGLILTVTFLDVRPADTPCDRLAAFAVRVATFVRHNYDGFDSLRTVSVAFAPRGSGGPSAATSSHLPLRFSRTALQTGQLAADSSNAVALCELDVQRPSAEPGRAGVPCPLRAAGKPLEVTASATARCVSPDRTRRNSSRRSTNDSR